MTLQHIVLGLVAVGAGTILIMRRLPLGRWATRRWGRLGVEVPEELYARQFGFIGVLLVILGLLTLAGLVGVIF